VRLLRDKLEWLRTFIRNADRRRRLRDDEFITVWVRQTCDVAFEAEDALNDFLHRAGLRWRKATLGSGCAVGGWWWWPGRCAGQVTLRHDLSRRNRQIRNRLNEISENRAVYNMEHTPAPAWAVSSSATALATWYEAVFAVNLSRYPPVKWCCCPSRFILQRSDQDSYGFSSCCAREAINLTGFNSVQG
jgi:acetylornithine deacetylase/succinyl-diaminopimelate desuccinylase-like protein